MTNAGMQYVIIEEESVMKRWHWPSKYLNNSFFLLFSHLSIRVLWGILRNE